MLLPAYIIAVIYYIIWCDYFSSFPDLRFLGSNCVPVTINTFITAETYRNDIVQIYSNSWGFVGEGDTVVSLGSVWSMALQDAMTVCINK